jgi:hypothetical protein
MRHFTLAAIGFLSSVTAAQAGFLGFEIRIDAAATTAAQSIDGVLSNATVYRLYALFDDAGNEVFNVFNTDIATTVGATLYQDGFGTDTAPSDSFLSVIPTLEFDSFITINRLTDAGDATATDPDFAFTSNGVEGGWFNGDPTNGQGLAASVGVSGAFETLIAQFTVVSTLSNPDPAAVWFGFASITYSDATGATQQLANQNLYPPSPGAAPLFVIAALAHRRRRA